MRMSKKAKQFIENAKLTEEYWLAKAKMDFSIELAKHASSMNIKSKDLAEKLGTSAPYISKVFTGNANLTIESMVKLARAVDSNISITFEKMVPNVNFDMPDQISTNVVSPPPDFWKKLKPLQNSAKDFNHTYAAISDKRAFELLKSAG